MEIKKDVFQRLRQEQENKKRDKEIICPYCEYIQDTDTKYNHVSYWGEESLNKITCEGCGKGFWVEEKVNREFETTTTEFLEAYNKYISKIVTSITKKS